MAQHNDIAKHVAERGAQRRSGPVWAIYVAGGWSLLYGALACFWAIGGSGFPFGAAGDPGAVLSILGGVTPGFAAIVAPVCFAGAAVAVAMALAPRRGLLRYVLLGFAWAAAAGLALLIPDYRVLVAVAYTPIFLAGAPFGWPPGVRLSEAYPWPVLNQLLCIGGLLWASAAVAYGRLSRGATEGRAATTASWTAPQAAARWGRWAVGIAVLIPVLYAITRWAWALGIPLGISREFLREGQAIGMWWAGAALATIAVGGALLTLGLVQRWGEVFPRWLPFMGGKRVPRRWRSCRPALSRCWLPRPA